MLEKYYFYPDSIKGWERGSEHYMATGNKEKKKKLHVYIQTRWGWPIKWLTRLTCPVDHESWRQSLVLFMSIFMNPHLEPETPGELNTCGWNWIKFHTLCHDFAKGIIKFRYLYLNIFLILFSPYGPRLVCSLFYYW